MLYDYKCDSCSLEFEAINSIEERFDAVCPSCNNRARKLVNCKIATALFPEGYWHNIGPRPIYISSASQLAEECKKRWTPSNKPWPEYLDGFSRQGLPSDVKYKGAEGHKTKEELCREKTERINKMAELAAKRQEVTS